MNSGEANLVKISNFKNRFEKFSKEIEEQFRKHKITQKDVSKAVKWAKRRSS